MVIATPDPPLDALWLNEAEGRLAAYRAGELGAINAEQVFADLGKNILRRDSRFQFAKNLVARSSTTMRNASDWRTRPNANT